jgi:hypothetical protein
MKSGNQKLKESFQSLLEESNAIAGQIAQI